MDTVARNFKEYHTMVLTDSNEVYYIDDNILGSTTTSTTLDLTSDFQYPLNKDDKNMDYTLDKRSAHLAYDTTSGKVYLLANGLPYREMKIFDVTDLDNPTVVMARDMKGMDYDDVYRIIDDDYITAEQCYCLSNGALIVPSSLEAAYIIYPQQAAIDALDRVFRGYTFIAGDTVFFMDSLYDTVKTAPFQSMSNTTEEFSVEGGIPYLQYSCAGPNGLYSWSADEGLFYIDAEGWKHSVVNAKDIECKDFLPIPNSIRDMRVNQNGSCILFDSTTKSIRILEKQN